MTPARCRQPAPKLRLAPLGLLLLSLLGPARAESIKVLVQRSPLAGFQYYAGDALWQDMRAGDKLALRREPDNPYDANAVSVEWHGIKLGYLPRAENRGVAAEMDRGTAVSARIAKLQEHRNPWRRLLIEVFVVF